MTELTGRSEPARWQVLLAFAGVYLIWGSTYLAVRFAVQTIPPFIMTGTRFVISGSVVFAWARLRGAPLPKLRQWGPAAVVGGLLMFGAMGGGAWALQFVPSGIGAVLVGSVPIWVVLEEWLLFKGRRPSGGVLLGLLLGMLGIVLIVGPDQLLRNTGGGALMSALGMLVIVGGATLWAFGSLFSRDADLPDSPRLTLGMEMLSGAAFLMLAALVSGDFGRLDVGAVTLRSVLSLTYLALVGSILAFSAYFFLLRNVAAARAATFAYVNPVIALFLGWALGDEPLTARTLVASAVIIAGVVIINTRRESGA